MRRQLLGDVAREAVRRCGVLDERVQPQKARPASAAEHAGAAQRKLDARRGCNPSARLNAGRRRRRVHHVAEPCAIWAPCINVASALPRTLDANAQRSSRPVGRWDQRLPAARNTRRNTRLRHGSAAQLVLNPARNACPSYAAERSTGQLQAEEGDRECRDAGTAARTRDVSGACIEPAPARSSVVPATSAPTKADCTLYVCRAGGAVLSKPKPPHPLPRCLHPRLLRCAALLVTVESSCACRWLHLLRRMTRCV